MNHITNTAPALEIFDKAYRDFDHCFYFMRFNTIEQWSFEIGALNCSDVFKSFNQEQLQELYDVLRLDAFSRAQVATEYMYCVDDFFKLKETRKYASEMNQLDLEMKNQLLRFKVMAMENMARATDSYAMDFTQ